MICPLLDWQLDLQVQDTPPPPFLSGGVCIAPFILQEHLTHPDEYDQFFYEKITDSCHKQKNTEQSSD